MERILFNTFDFWDNKAEQFKNCSEVLTIQHRGLTPRELITRIQNGISTQSDLHRELPNDNDTPLETDNFIPDELDLCTVKQLLKNSKETLNDKLTEFKNEQINAANELTNELKNVNK